MKWFVIKDDQVRNSEEAETCCSHVRIDKRRILFGISEGKWLFRTPKHKLENNTELLF
jgi:hypothetical protein